MSDMQRPRGPSTEAQQATKDCRLEKALRSMSGNVLAMDWTATWEYVGSGIPMHGHGGDISRNCEMVSWWLGKLRSTWANRVRVLLQMTGLSSELSI
jgi:hypothetical protein